VLLEERARGAGRGVGLQQGEGLLVAALALHGKGRAIGQPLDPREVGVGIGAEVHAHGGALADRGDEQLHVGVACAGGGIALLHRLGALGRDLEALDFRDRRVVDARERDAPFVGRPPVAGVAVHFLLRDELRGAVGDESATRGRNRDLAPAGNLDRVHARIAHETHVAAPWRKTGIGLVGGRPREAAYCARPRGVEIVKIQITAERHEDVPAVGRQVVFEDAAQRGGALPLASRRLLG
jgi:hypothetical protein